MYVFETLRALNLQITGRKCTLQCTTKTQTTIAYRKRTPKHEANSQALNSQAKTTIVQWYTFKKKIQGL